MPRIRNAFPNNHAATPLNNPILAKIASEPSWRQVSHVLMKLRSQGLDIRDPEVAQIAIDAGRAEYERVVEIEAAQLERFRHGGRGHYPVVYYMKLGDLVKIGTTTHIIGRRSALGAEKILAVEPGDWRDEAIQHVRFRGLRVSGEWFRNEDPLTSHIDQVAAGFAEEFGSTLDEWLAYLKTRPSK